MLNADLLAAAVGFLRQVPGQLERWHAKQCPTCRARRQSQQSQQHQLQSATQLGVAKQLALLQRKARWFVVATLCLHLLALTASLAGPLWVARHSHQQRSQIVPYGRTCSCTRNTDGVDARYIT